MSEKLTHEIRVIETEDGFRIELKGDKEELRRLLFGGGWANLRHFFQQFAHHQHRPFRREEFARHQHRPFGHGEFAHHEHGHSEEEREMRRGGRKHHRYDLGPWWDESATGENT